MAAYKGNPGNRQTLYTSNALVCQEMRKWGLHGSAPASGSDRSPTRVVFFCFALLWKRMVLRSDGCRLRNGQDKPVACLKREFTMALTPSKDHKRREREQKKVDKRFAREVAKTEKLRLQQAAAAEALKASEAEALKTSEADAQAKLEAEFEAELAAEAAKIKRG
jgi:hypothetical protein